MCPKRSIVCVRLHQPLPPHKSLQEFCLCLRILVIVAHHPTFLKIFRTSALGHDTESKLINKEPIHVVDKEKNESRSKQGECCL